MNNIIVGDTVYYREKDNLYTVMKIYDITTPMDRGISCNFYYAKNSKKCVGPVTKESFYNQEEVLELKLKELLKC